MEMPLDLLKAKEIKKRLHGIAQVLDTVRQDNTRGKECITCCLEQVVSCLRDHNSKITSIALSIIQHVTRSPFYKSFAPISSILRANQKALWSNMIERLGDNKIQVRESAVQVMLEVSQIFGVENTFEQLEPCFTHKNWRTRQQSLCCKWNLIKNSNFVDTCKHQFLDKIISGLEDSSKDVRETAMQILEELYTHSGPSLWALLQEKGVRSAHIKDITGRCKNRSVENRVIPNGSIHGTDDNFARFQALLSSTKAKVTSQPKEINPLAPSRNISKNAISSKNDATHNTGLFTEREMERELLKVQTDLASPNDWERRVGALKALQMIVTKIKGQDQLIMVLSQRLRAFRNRLCEQIGDLRSSVSREACSTIEALVQVLREEFNSHAECFVLSLLKATCVTIQVVSTSADKTIRSIIKSSHDGFTKILTKFLDGTRSKNQLLRYNCVLYMTMILQYWSPASIHKQRAHYVQAFPMILQDADSEVRAQARKCYWRFHHLFKEEAIECLKRLDLSVQRNVYDDAARDSAELGPDTSRQIEFPISTKESLLGKEPLLGKRSQDKVVLPSTAESKFQYQASRSGAHDSDIDFVPKLENDGASLKIDSAGSNLSGPRRVLGASLTSNFQSDSILSRSTFGTGPVRVESTVCQKSDAKNGAKEVSSMIPLSSTLRVTQGAGTKNNGDGESNTISSQGSLSWKPERILQNAPPTSSKSNRTELKQDTRSKSHKKYAKATAGPKRCIMNASSHSNSDDVTLSDSSTREKGSIKGQGAQDNSDTGATEGLGNESIRARLNAFFTGVTNNGWSHRLDALQRLSALLNQRGKTEFSKQSEEKVFACLVKELADPHYRVAQYALEVFVVFIRAHEPVSHILKHIKVMLPRLFQKAVDSKEVNRKHAREVLDFLVARIEIPILVSHLLPLIIDGGNVKMKVLVCQYMTKVLPLAGACFKETNSTENTKNIRSLLNKIAQALDGDAPLSYNQACGDLLVATKKTYSHEVDQAIMSLTPGKRQVITRVLSSRGIRIGTTKQVDVHYNAPTQIIAAEESKEDANSSEVASAPDEPFQSTQCTDLFVEAIAIDDSAAPDRASFSEIVEESVSCTLAVNEKNENLERQLKCLASNYNNEQSLKRVLHEITKIIKTYSIEFWIDNRDRLLSHLMARLYPHDQEHNISILKVVRKLLERYPSHLESFLHDLVHQLMNYTTQRQKLISYIAESCLQKIVSDKENAHAALAILLSSCSPNQPEITLITSLRIIRTALSSIQSGDKCVLPKESDLLMTLLEMLSHNCSEVRKNAVNCIVRYHYLMEGDENILKYVSEHTDALKFRLVAIYIEREANKDQIDTKDMESSENDPATVHATGERFF